MATRAWRPDPDHCLHLVRRAKPLRTDRGIALLWMLMIAAGGAELGFAIYGFIHLCTIVANKLEALIP